MIGMDHGRDGGLFIARITENVGIGIFMKPFKELVSYQTIDDESSSRKTHLAAVIEHHRRLFCRQFKIGVGEHNEGTLPSEFGGKRNQIAGCFHADDATGLRRPGEADPTGPGIAHQRRTNLLTNPLHHVEHARGHTCVFSQISEQ